MNLSRQLDKVVMLHLVYLGKLQCNLGRYSTSIENSHDTDTCNYMQNGEASSPLKVIDVYTGIVNCSICHVEGVFA